MMSNKVLFRGVSCLVGGLQGLISEAVMYCNLLDDESSWKKWICVPFFKMGAQAVRGTPQKEMVTQLENEHINFPNTSWRRGFALDRLNWLSPVHSRCGRPSGRPMRPSGLNAGTTIFSHQVGSILCRYDRVIEDRCDYRSFLFYLHTTIYTM